jgi:hypothetical protein
VSLISSKDQATTEISRIHAIAERKSGNLLCALRTDRGGGGLQQNCSKSIVMNWESDVSSLLHTLHNRMEWWRRGTRLLCQQQGA